MHIYFSGIGGTGIGPLALIAAQAGYTVSGSDKQDSDYITYLRSHGITNIHIGQEYDQIQSIHQSNPIEWFVHTSALSIEHPNAPELAFCRDHAIEVSKRDELINHIIAERNLKLIAIAGTHGKTTTTAMMIWLLKQLQIPVSYSVGAKISYGEMGEFDSSSEYFVYEADEFDRNFLQFRPFVSVIPGIAYDHPDIYPTQDDYNQAFAEFINASQKTVLRQSDKARLTHELTSELHIVDDSSDPQKLQLVGEVNRNNAQLVASTAVALELCTFEKACELLSQFPGLSRRFEQISEHIISDYAHTPEKIMGALQMAHEVAGENVVVVYEGLHNTRQHFIKEQLKTLFSGTKKLYVVPSYLAREDETLDLLTPEKLTNLIAEPTNRIPAQLNASLQHALENEVQNGNLVLCLSAGGGGSLDEWLRKTFLS